MNDLTTGGICKWCWRTGGDGEGRRLGEGGGRRRHGRRVPVKQDETRLQFLLVFSDLRKLKLETF